MGRGERRIEEVERVYGLEKVRRSKERVGIREGYTRLGGCRD